MIQSKWLGKIIGGLCGYFAIGPWGLCIGILLGHLFDKGIWNFEKKPDLAAQKAFFEATFLVMGYIAKASDNVLNSETQATEYIMHKLHLSDAKRLEAMKLLAQGKHPDFDLEVMLKVLKQACSGHLELLTLFLELQIQAAYENRNDINVKVKHILGYIAQYLEIGFLNFNRRATHDVYDHSSHHTTSLQNAYLLLGISSQSSLAEVKKAYRKMISQYHPDKLMAKGVSPEMIKMATERTQQIKRAYEQIRTARA